MKKIIYLVLSIMALSFLMSQNIYASTGTLPSTYTVEDLSNFAITVNTFCASNVHTVDNALSYNAYDYSTQEYSTYSDTFNYYTIYNPNNCQYWGVSRIDLDNWAIAPDTYIYTELIVDSMYAGYNEVGSGVYGYINTTTWDMQLHDNQWNTYGLVKDGLLVSGRFHYTISEENGYFYDDTEYNFYSSSSNPYLYPRFGSSALVSNNGSWSPQYFGNANNPIWYNSAGAASMSFSLRVAYSSTPDDWYLPSSEESGDSGEYPDLDYERDETQNAADDSINSGLDSSQDAEDAMTNFINVIGGFVSVITNTTPTNCRLNGNMGHIDMGVLDLCSLPAPAFVQVIGSLILIAIVIPFVIVMFNRFINLFRSFTG